MKPRMDYFRASPKGAQAMLSLQAHVNACGLEHSLLELVKMRASQINGCAYCLDMHSKDARAAGETEQRLYVLDAWREAPFYSERERAALAWTEAVTRIGEGHVPDDLYAATREHFSEEELANLTLAVVAINGVEPSLDRVQVAGGNVSPGHVRAHEKRMNSYRRKPQSALVTLRSQGRIGEGIACRVETGRALVEAGLHPATGGSGLQGCCKPCASHHR